MHILSCESCIYSSSLDWFLKNISIHPCKSPHFIQVTSVPGSTGSDSMIVLKLDTSHFCFAVSHKKMYATPQRLQNKQTKGLKLFIFDWIWIHGNCGGLNTYCSFPKRMKRGKTHEEVRHIVSIKIFAQNPLSHRVVRVSYRDHAFQIEMCSKYVM